MILGTVVQVSDVANGPLVWFMCMNLKKCLHDAFFILYFDRIEKIEKEKIITKELKKKWNSKGIFWL